MSTFDDKPSLPSIGHEISRPSSTSTVASANYSQHRHGSHASIQLPALNTLARVASNSPPAMRTSLDSNDNVSRRGTPPKQSSPPPRCVCCSSEEGKATIYGGMSKRTFRDQAIKTVGNTRRGLDVPKETFLSCTSYWVAVLEVRLDMMASRLMMCWRGAGARGAQTAPRSRLLLSAPPSHRTSQLQKPLLPH
jgi:hypothetical protein